MKRTRRDLVEQVVLPLAFLFFLVVGGVFNRIEWNPSLMLVMASPMLILLTLVAVGFAAVSSEASRRIRLLLWCFGSGLAGFFLEGVGVHTGFPFGEYTYSGGLGLQLLAVPVSIGFAWVLVLLGAHSLLQLVHLSPKNDVAHAAAIGGIMVAFDLVMEPAAIHLGYWQWQGHVPFQNYLTWWVAGSLLAFWGLKWGALQGAKSRLPAFLLLAQVVFFLVSIL